MHNLIPEAEAAEQFDVKKTTMARWRKKYKIAHYKLAGRVYYKAEDLEAFIEKLRVR